jgi:hypothetical protein
MLYRVSVLQFPACGSNSSRWSYRTLVAVSAVGLGDLEGSSRSGSCSNGTSLCLVKDRYGEPQRGEWMGADKNSSRMRWRLQQDERGFQHTSPTHYPSWPSPRGHWSATGPRNQQTTFRAKTHQHAQRKLARLAACAAPVRLIACAG